MNKERKERIRYYGFAAFVGVLLLLNWLGIFKTFLGIDTAVIITLLAGYKTFYNSISSLLEKKISADLAICVAVVAALFLLIEHCLLIQQLTISAGSLFFS